jgi:hypothetical protein
MSHNYVSFVAILFRYLFIPSEQLLIKIVIVGFGETTNLLVCLLKWLCSELTCVLCVLRVGVLVCLCWYVWCVWVCVWVCGVCGCVVCVLHLFSVSVEEVFVYSKHYFRMSSCVFS